jgi:voltage-gated potassium channel
LNQLVRIVRGLRVAFSDGRVLSLLALVFTMIACASVFYHYMEKWSWLDSVYFSVVAISTVGFGDISPQTAPGKIFTIFYLLVGLGIFVAAATTIADAIINERDRSEED